jgi:hypothetical protein
MERVWVGVCVKGDTKEPIRSWCSQRSEKSVFGRQNKGDGKVTYWWGSCQQKPKTMHRVADLPMHSLLDTPSSVKKIYMQEWVNFFHHPGKQKKRCWKKWKKKIERKRTMFAIHPSGTDKKTDVAKDLEHVRVCVFAIEWSSSLWLYWIENRQEWIILDS